eukprot:4650023-Pleurochrysis_carterae.AAC.1
MAKTRVKIGNSKYKRLLKPRGPPAVLKFQRFQLRGVMLQVWDTRGMGMDGWISWKRQALCLYAADACDARGAPRRRSDPRPYRARRPRQPYRDGAAAA